MILEAVPRDELVRLRHIERLARACFMQTGHKAVAAHIRVAMNAKDDRERLVGLERALLQAGSLAGGANDKLLSRVYELAEALKG